MNSLKISITLLISLSLFGCVDTTPLSHAEWLIGTWEHTNHPDVLFEHWRKQDDFTLKGMGYQVKGEDTVVLETIKISTSGDGLIYQPFVADQNDGMGVKFAATTLEPDEMIFENPSHDFPQFIRYQRIDSASLVAEIWAYQDGDKNVVQFPMRRVNQTSN